MIVFPFLLKGQSVKNLKRQLNKESSRTQVNLRNQLATLLLTSDPEQGMEYAEEADRISKKINYTLGRARANAVLGNLQVRDDKRADLSARSHRTAYELYKSLYETGQLSRLVLESFIRNDVGRTYNYITNNKVKRKRRALKIYQPLYIEIMDYLADKVSKTQRELNVTQNELNVGKSKQRQLIMDKIKLGGRLEKKEIEALALEDSLLRRKLQLKEEALKRQKLEKEKAVQKAQTKQEKAKSRQRLIFIYAGLIVIVLTIALGGMIYNDYRKQKKVNQVLEQQKTELYQKNEEVQQQQEEILTQRDNLEQLTIDLRTQNTVIEEEKTKSETLLLNILPEEVAQELKDKGKATPQYYEMASVLFTDFKGFTKISEKLNPEQIIEELNYCFMKFDEIIEKYDLEKIKTIGDAYMCAGGLPIPNRTNAIDAVKAGLAMQRFMEGFKKEKISKGEPVWELRLGIHTGSLVAGVIGTKKFAYDIWGDTVNVAARMESSGKTGKVNISESTYSLVKNHFNCNYRGKIQAKNKGEIDMYFVEQKQSLFQSMKQMT